MNARPQTAMAAALQRAGMNTAKTRLYQLGVDMLRKHRATRDRGFSVFEGIVEDDPDLVREALAFYYERLDTDMSGSQLSKADQNQIAARQSNGDSGHPPPGTHTARHIRKIADNYSPAALLAFNGEEIRR